MGTKEGFENLRVSVVCVGLGLEAKRREGFNL